MDGASLSSYTLVLTRARALSLSLTVCPPAPPQAIVSVRAKDVHANAVIEALRRAKYKFPGRQKILKSTKWGFTEWTREEYVKGRNESWLKVDGNGVKYVAAHGPLTDRHFVYGRINQPEEEEEDEEEEKTAEPAAAKAGGDY